MCLWGSRMEKELDQEVAAFSTSIQEDQYLYRYDIWGSIAHSTMLQKIGIVTSEEHQKMVTGLKQVGEEIETKQYDVSSFEDIHSAVEIRLKELIGESAGKLHTARSRNDQIVLDERLYLREQVVAIIRTVNALQESFLKKARRYRDVVMPGYTHLQPAQPVLFGHHCMAYFFMFQRDAERLQESLSRINVLPLGAGALAGTSLPIDCQLVADLLAFPNVQDNSMDTVADRDFLLEVLSDLAIASLHLCRMGEEIVLWSSPAFQFITIDDAFTTGSSIMPQKKNPDVAELIRGKTGEMVGSWISLAMTLKGLPLTYNRDLQQDKLPLLRAVEIGRLTFHIASRLVDHITPNIDKMEQALQVGFLTATDLCEYFVTLGIPFRKAHEMVGSLVRKLSSSGQTLHDLAWEDLQKEVEGVGPEVIEVLNEKKSIQRKKSAGSSSPGELEKQLQKGDLLLAKWNEQNTELEKTWASSFLALVDIPKE
ncbi:MAG: argininosuccinate lyase [Candidatus Atribacteria bacterium]|nr:argininosuccinate lyase [Candidatus Atribacteria bacterium]